MDTRSMQEIIRDRKAPSTKWGDWELDQKNRFLDNVAEDYNIDLAGVRNSAQMLDWIFQIAGKSWATNDTIGDLVRAFDEIFYPQKNFCSWGQECNPNSDDLVSDYLIRLAAEEHIVNVSV